MWTAFTVTDRDFGGAGGEVGRVAGGEVGRGAAGGEVGREYVALHDDLRAVLAMRRSAHAAAFALRESDGRMRLLYLGGSMTSR